MIWWQWIILIIITISTFFILFNRKLINSSLIKDQLGVYCKYTGIYGCKKISWFDIFCFLVLPIVISCSVVWGFDYQLDRDSTNVILTVTSILFSVLFTVLSIITSKIKSADKIEREVVRETFVTITTITWCLIISILISIVYSLLLAKLDNVILFKILTNVLFAILVHSFALLLMVIKRFYLVFSNSRNDSDNN